jgi:predicted nucleic acid-binding protein
MNRKQLLESAMTEEKNVATVVTTTLKKDAKVLNKAKRDLEDALDEAEETLEERLSSNVPLDKSVIEVLFAKTQQLKNILALYDDFDELYFKSEK